MPTTVSHGLTAGKHFCVPVGVSLWLAVAEGADVAHHALVATLRYMDVFARFLDLERQRRGLSIRKLAKLVGLSAQTISDWARDKSISADSFDQLLDALKLDHATAFRVMSQIAQKMQQDMGTEPVRVETPQGNALVTPAVVKLLQPPAGHRRPPRKP